MPSIVNYVGGIPHLHPSLVHLSAIDPMISAGVMLAKVI